jgi:hypothetical protein
MGAKGGGRAHFVPPGWPTRIHALLDVVRFGPGLLPAPAFLVFLFLADRTLPFKKEHDTAAGSQAVNGIYQREPKMWHRLGSGVCDSTFWRCIKVLEELDLICKLKRHLPGRHNDEPSDYTINWCEFRRLVETARGCPVGEKGQPLLVIRDKAKKISAALRSKNQASVIDTKAAETNLLVSEEAKRVATFITRHGIIDRRTFPKDGVRATLACAREMALPVSARDIAAVLKLCGVLGPKTHLPIGVQQISGLLGELGPTIVRVGSANSRRYMATAGMRVERQILHKLKAASQLNLPPTVS